MKMESHGDTLCISDVTELGAVNSNALRDEARAALTTKHRNIEIDLSQTSFLDSCGLGALIALHKTACSRRGMVRLINPTLAVQQMLELTHLNRIFEVAKP